MERSNEQLLFSLSLLDLSAPDFDGIIKVSLWFCFLLHSLINFDAFVILARSVALYP